MNIPYRELRNRLDNNTADCKTTRTYDNSVISKALFALITKIINKFEHMTEYETGIFVRSLDKWMDRKDVYNVAENSVVPKIGDICMIDWNINYTPELAYNHPGVIVNIINDLILVVPVSSTHIDDAYHPTTNPTGNIHYRKVDTIDGFNKECALHLGEAKVISKSRIINRMNELLPSGTSSNPLLEEIINTMHTLYFSNKKNEYETKIAELQRKLEQKELQCRKSQSRTDRYRIKCIRLEKSIAELRNS